MLWRSRESRPSRTSVTVAPPASDLGTTTVEEESVDVVVDLDDDDAIETSVNDDDAEVVRDDAPAAATEQDTAITSDHAGTEPPAGKTDTAAEGDALEHASTTTNLGSSSPSIETPVETPVVSPVESPVVSSNESPVDRSIDTPAPTPTEVPAVAPTARTRVGPAIVIAVANQKGGVGKTTTTVSLAAALADKGVRVLVVDLDPQGNATTGLGGRATKDDATSYDVLLDEATVADATIMTEVEGLHLVPASLDLAGAEIELVPAFSREARLRKAIADIRSQYDIVMIDCPPSLGLITINALVAADRVLVPIQCEYYALEGLGQLMKTVELVAGNLNSALELGGIAMTMYDARTKLSQQVVDEVRNHFDDLVFETVIPRTVRLSEAPSFGQPITVFDPASRGARAYRRLGDEVARRFDLLDAEPAPSTSALDRLLGTSGMTSTTVRPDPDEDTGAWT